MKFRKILQSKGVEFLVEGRPPRKGVKSCWSKEGQHVLKLREKALEYRTKKELEYFDGPVKVELTVYDPNMINRQNSHEYHGDLDTLVAGVLDSLQPAPKHPQFKIDPMLEKENIDPTKPLLIKDDSQVVKIIAKKVKGAPHYKVKITSEKMK